MIAINEEIMAEIRRLLETQIQVTADAGRISAMTSSEWREYKARNQKIKALFGELDKARHMLRDSLSRLAH